MNEILKKVLDEIVKMDYPASGIGCGLEDVDITDRYNAAEYGWNEAIERVVEIINNYEDEDGWIPCKNDLPKEEGVYTTTVLSKSGYKVMNLVFMHNEFCKMNQKDVVLAWREEIKPFKEE